MRPLLALSAAIDVINEKIGYVCNFLVLAACVVSAARIDEKKTTGRVSRGRASSSSFWSASSTPPPAARASRARRSASGGLPRRRARTVMVMAPTIPATPDTQPAYVVPW